MIEFNKKIKKKHRLFCEAYSNHNDGETYQDATKSAIRAGYIRSNAASRRCKLLKTPIIRQYITYLEAVHKEKYNVSIDDARAEAWKKYKETGKGKWFNEYCSLSGFYVQKQEVHQTIEDITEEQSKFVAIPDEEYPEVKGMNRQQKRNWLRKNKKRLKRIRAGKIRSDLRVDHK